MALARWQATIVDENGDIQPGASVEVRREVIGAPLASLYEDRDGETPIANPFTVGDDGVAAFHAVGGAYRIRATKDGFSRTWRYVGIGLAQEQDAVVAGIAFAFDAGTADADPGTGAFRFDHASPDSAAAIYISEADEFGNDVAAWLAMLDDAGAITHRGIIVIRSGDGLAQFVGIVTGSIVDSGDYRQISVTPLAATADATFVAGAKFGVQFSPSGIDGLYSGTEGQVTAAPSDLIPLQDASDGGNAKRATAQSIADQGRIIVELMPFGFSEDVLTGSGDVFFLVPDFMVGWSLTAVQARHITASGAGSTGTTSIQLDRSGADMLATPLTIDALEHLSSDAATSAVIQSNGNQLLGSNSYLRIAVDAIPTGGDAPRGLAVAMTFTAP